MQTATKRVVSSISTKVVISVDSVQNGELAGSIYSAFCNESMRFYNACQMIAILDDLFDQLSFPQSSVNYRKFSSKNCKTKQFKKTGDNMDSKEIKKNSAARFVVHVQFRQNATWQGTIQWLDENKTQKFRSTMEMLKLMDEAVSSMQDDENTKAPSFFVSDDT